MTHDLYTGWHKSSYSNSTGGCVEVGAAAEKSAAYAVGVRDTRQFGRGPVVEFTAEAWRAFLSDIRAGHFDR